MKLSDDFKSALRHFTYYYTNGTLPYVIGDEKLLEGIDYREMLKTEASLLKWYMQSIPTILKWMNTEKY
tara:strand:- start:21520 stop:21726 length:207 start_codon:yes stop_codon:yes gene_type:complete